MHVDSCDTINPESLSHCSTTVVADEGWRNHVDSSIMDTDFAGDLHVMNISIYIRLWELNPANFVGSPQEAFLAGSWPSAAIA